MHDSLIEEIRNFRDEYARGFNYDLDAMCADLRNKQNSNGGRVASLPKRAVQVGRFFNGSKASNSEVLDSESPDVSEKTHSVAGD